MNSYKQSSLFFVGPSDDVSLFSPSCDGSSSDEGFIRDDGEDPQSVKLPLRKGGPVKSLSCRGKTKRVLQEQDASNFDPTADQVCADEGPVPRTNQTLSACTTVISRTTSAEHLVTLKSMKKKTSIWPKRKRLLEKLQNKGNYEDNQDVMRNHGGTLKVKRRTKPSRGNNKTYVHRVCCKGTFVGKEPWLWPVLQSQPAPRKHEAR